MCKTKQFEVIEMELRREEEYSSVTIFDNSDNFFKLSETARREPWTNDNDQGDIPEVRVVERASSSQFSALLQFFRIFLLIYHSIKWDEVQQTTGQSRQQSKYYEDFGLCDWLNIYFLYQIRTEFLYHN